MWCAFSRSTYQAFCPDLEGTQGSEGRPILFSLRPEMTTKPRATSTEPAVRSNNETFDHYCIFHHHHHLHHLHLLPTTTTAAATTPRSPRRSRITIIYVYKIVNIQLSVVQYIDRWWHMYNVELQLEFDKGITPPKAKKTCTTAGMRLLINLHILAKSRSNHFTGSLEDELIGSDPHSSISFLNWVTCSIRDSKAEQEDKQNEHVIGSIKTCTHESAGIPSIKRTQRSKQTVKKRKN